MKKFIMLILLIFSVLISTKRFYNYYKKNNVSMQNFIDNNCTTEFVMPDGDYNLYFFVSPLTCDICRDYLMEADSILKNIRAIFKNKGKKTSINFIITGDYTHREKLEYISKIKTELDNYYLENKTMVIKFLLIRYHTARLPFLVVLNKELIEISNIKFPPLSKQNDIDNFLKGFYQKIEVL